MSGRRFLSRAALTVLALHLALAVPPTLRDSARRLRAAVRHLDETPLEARRRVFGAAWVAGIAEARRAVPEDGVYLLVDGQEREEGALYWVRFDLAPRRALLLGKLAELPPPAELRRRVPARARVVVVATGKSLPPRVLDRASFLRWLAGRDRR